MSRQESAEERAQRIIAELRAATSDAAGVAKDLRALVKEVRESLPMQARAEVARVLVPAIEGFSEQLTQTIHAAEVEVKDRFNETSAGIRAVLQDLVARGLLYELGSPVVEGVEAVEAMIKDARRATGI